ncbi:hypothetical protein ACWEOA_29655, partial [Streptomyces sp. NPDC004457]
PPSTAVSRARVPARGGSVGKDAGAEALVMGIHTLPGAVVVYRSGLLSAGPEARAGLPRQAPPRQRPR